MPKIPNSTTSKKGFLSPKKLNPGSEKILETKNLSPKLKKQRRLPLSLKRLRFIRLKTKKEGLPQLQL